MRFKPGRAPSLPRPPLPSSTILVPGSAWERTVSRLPPAFRMLTAAKLHEPWGYVTVRAVVRFKPGRAPHPPSPSPLRLGNTLHSSFVNHFCFCALEALTIWKHSLCSTLALRYSFPGSAWERTVSRLPPAFQGVERMLSCVEALRLCDRSSGGALQAWARPLTPRPPLPCEYAGERGPPALGESRCTCIFVNHTAL